MRRAAAAEMRRAAAAAAVAARSAVEAEVEEAPVAADTSSFGDEDEWDWGDD